MTEALYKSIVEESNDGIFVAQGGDIIYANEKLQELTGYSNTELVGSPKTRIVAPAHSVLVKSHHRARMEGDSVPNQFEIDLQTSAGERVPVELSVSRITDEGKPASVSFCRDLSEQKERERTLEGIVSKANNIVEATSKAEIGQVAVDIAHDVLGAPLAGMHLLSDDSQCLEMVAAIDEVREEFGVPPTYKKTTEDAPSEVVWEAFESTEPVYLDDTREYATLAEETPARSAIVEPLGDHGVFIISATEPEAFDQTDRNLVELLTQILTATLDRQKRERELEQSRKRIQGLFDESPDMINVHDSNGVIVDSNPQLSEKLGYTTDELVGKYIWEIDQLADPTQTREALADLETGERFRVEGRYQCKDGSTIPVELQIRRLALSDGDEFLVSSRDITERKEREQQIQTLTERLELAVEGANLGVWDWDMTTDEVEFNDQWANMLGHSLADIEPHLDAWENRVHPSDLDEVEAALDAHIEGETTYYESEHRMKTADGDWKWIRDIGKIAERDEDGEPVRAVGIHLDIDDRKSYEQTLKEERDMFTQGPAVVFNWRDADEWPVEYVSDNVTDVFGYTPEELESGEISYIDIIHEEDLERVSKKVATNSDEGIERFSHDPYRIVTAEGEIRWVLDHTKNVWDDGDITHRLGYLVDITERKEREQELEWHERLIEESIDVPTVIDSTGTITYVSPSVRRVLGYEPDELLGKRGFEFQHPDDREDVANAIEKLQSSPDSPQTVQVRFRRADGSWRWIESRMQNFLDHERISGIIVNSREVTERKEYEQELESQRDNLKILNQVVRHDIRNDLQVVSAYAEKCQTYVDESGEEYLTKVLEASRDAVNITETARDITETMLQSSTDLDLVNLRYVLDREVDDVRSNYEQGVVTVEGSIPDIKVRADDMLESVFRNLLGNAIQHNDKEIPEVTVSATVEDDMVVIEVADNGPGVPDHRKAKIFEENEQGLDSHGTGLGLYLVETLIERYSGDIRVADNEPDGAVFITTLPIDE
ncbi:PAS domain S-box protein [Salinibaculum salinum]|uniref:PAS domain S-box protein n=1 Tax=Salinibaculum salinum TaxID=3131996 RepID=UPI0030EE4678